MKKYWRLFFSDLLYLYICKNYRTYIWLSVSITGGSLGSTHPWGAEREPGFLDVEMDGEGYPCFSIVLFRKVCFEKQNRTKKPRYTTTTTTHASGYENWEADFFPFFVFSIQPLASSSSTPALSALWLSNKEQISPTGRGIKPFFTWGAEEGKNEK